MDSVPSRVEDILLALINNSEYDGPIISRVEQILYSFLENSEYAAEPESRVEAILVALKAAGLYDDAVISRIEIILYSKLNGTEYTAEPESRVEELLLEWELSEEKELTGVVPLLFNADGTPLLDYLISGNTVQSGTPTPDSPIIPQGTGERTGNLWNRDVPKYDYAKDYKKYNPDNTIALKAGTYTVSSDAKLPIIQVFDNSHTQLSVSDAIAISSSYFISWDGFALAPSTDTVRSGTIILLSDYILTFAVSGTLGTYIMLNLGSTALPYEPYGYKIPISSAGQTMPIYLGEVETTRRIKKLVLTGQETGWIKRDSPDNTYQISYPSNAVPYSGLCSHFANGGSRIGDLVNGEAHFGAGGFAARYDTVTTLDTWKSYLQQQYSNGTPVTVWYILATPETGIVNEPLMKIGDYTDSISMEQAGVEIPTVNGENTLDVLTTVKPSEVYIKYKRG